MATRTVYGTVRKPDGDPYMGYVINFRLENMLVLETTFYPPSDKKAATDANGYFSIGLTVPSDGTTVYRVTMGNQMRSYPVNIGPGGEIDLVSLLALENVIIPQSGLTESNVFGKTPSAVLDYIWDWSEWLQTSETLDTVTVTVPAGITEDYEANTNSLVVIWLSGGTDGSDYELLCHVVTNQAREENSTMTIKVRA
jgi:hypothetical protein